MYRTMVLIRRHEERVNELYLQGKIPSTLHLYIGQEAVATGVCANLRIDDYVLSTHRPHGHALAKGMEPRRLIAELFAKATGCCSAKGGSMHVGDIRVGAVPAIAIVGGNVPIASGVALAAKMQKTDRVAVCFFGDGAANEGAWHEGLNVAAIWELPVIFVCENNLYASTTPANYSLAGESVAGRAAAYGIPGYVTNGNDILEVRNTVGKAVKWAREAKGPSIVENKTYRYRGHFEGDPQKYRTQKEIEAFKSKSDPIQLFKTILKKEETLSDKIDKDLREEVNAMIEEAVRYAQESPLPKPEEALEDLFVNP